jgi:hypothetical protein
MLGAIYAKCCIVNVYADLRYAECCGTQSYSLSSSMKTWPHCASFRQERLCKHHTFFLAPKRSSLALEAVFVEV